MDFNLKNYEDLIVGTKKTDWTTISCWGMGAGPSYLNRFDVCETSDGDSNNLWVESHSEYMSLKKNLLVSVAHGLIHDDKFSESWTNNFEDRHAESHFIDFFYYGVLVYRDIYVSVDGGRCLLPLPKQIFNEKNEVEKLLITKPRYEFFKLLNDGQYDNYIKNAGIETSEGKWMNGD